MSGQPREFKGQRFPTGRGYRSIVPPDCIGSPRAAHALPYNPRRPRSRGGERFDRSTKYFLPVNADTGFVDGYSVRRISQIEAIISGVPEYRLIRALKQRKRRFWRPGCDTNYPRPHQRAPNQVDTDDRGKGVPEKTSAKPRSEFGTSATTRSRSSFRPSLMGYPRQCSIAACIRKPSHDGRSHLTVMVIFFEITGGLNR